MNEDLFANNDEERGKAESRKQKAETAQGSIAHAAVFSFQLSDLSFPLGQPIPELEAFDEDELDDIFDKLQGGK